MLTALRISFTALAEEGITGDDGKAIGLYNITQEDADVYELLQAADTVGVFQVESRAQMATLPRLRPACFYDIVIEVALIRPGPIQGDAVNPYLRRRRGREAITYAHPLMKPALEKTLGVPLFQEQLMQIAIDVAGFRPVQADRLRKAMGAKRSHERMLDIKDELYSGMEAKGIPRATRDVIYEKLDAFAEFGFPESHAFSFTYLVYASAWLKVHHPEHFYAGILAAQPMGFYSPQSLVADARRHGIRVEGPDVNMSHMDAMVRRVPQPRGTTCAAHTQPSPRSVVTAHPDLELRLGLHSIKGIGDAATRVFTERTKGKFTDLNDLCRRVRLSQRDIERLANAGDLHSLGVSRREALWAAHSLADRSLRSEEGYQLTIPGTEGIGSIPKLPVMSPIDEGVSDVLATGTMPHGHLVEFTRPALAERGCITISQACAAETGKRVMVGGIVTHRQRPHTAAGITFISLEDETGLLNVVCSVGLWARYKKIAVRESGLIIRGIVERGDGALNLVADKIDVLPLAVNLTSRDFR